MLHTMTSGIPLVLGLRTRMSDPYVYVVFYGPQSFLSDRGLKILQLTASCELGFWQGGSTSIKVAQMSYVSISGRPNLEDMGPI